MCLYTGDFRVLYGYTNPNKSTLFNKEGNMEISNDLYNKLCNRIIYLEDKWKTLILRQQLKNMRYKLEARLWQGKYESLVQYLNRDKK